LNHAITISQVRRNAITIHLFREVPLQFHHSLIYAIFYASGIYGPTFSQVYVHERVRTLSRRRFRQNEPARGGRPLARGGPREAKQWRSRLLPSSSPLHLPAPAAADDEFCFGYLLVGSRLSIKETTSCPDEYAVRGSLAGKVRERAPSWQQPAGPRSSRWRWAADRRDESGRRRDCGWTLQEPWADPEPVPERNGMRERGGKDGEHLERLRELEPQERHRERTVESGDVDHGKGARRPRGDGGWAQEQRRARRPRRGRALFHHTDSCATWWL